MLQPELLEWDTIASALPGRTASLALAGAARASGVLAMALLVRGLARQHIRHY